MQFSVRWVGQNIWNTFFAPPSLDLKFWHRRFSYCQESKWCRRKWWWHKWRGVANSIANVLTNSPHRKLLLHSNGFWRLDIIHSLQNYFNSYSRKSSEFVFVFCVWLISRSWHFQKSFICKMSLKHSSYHHYAIHYNWIKGIKTVKDYFWCPKSFTET